MYRKAKHDIQLAKEALSTCVAVRTPGLNEILAKYEAPHGINQNK